MARPSKPVAIMSKNLTDAEKKIRTETETQLKGPADSIDPPRYLNRNQKKIFITVRDQLQSAGIIGNLDIYILANFAITVDRLQTIETTVNQNPAKLSDKVLMSTKDKYSKDFYRACNELSLSPQSRAKIGNAVLQSVTEKSNPILDLLSEDDDND